MDRFWSKVNKSGAISREELGRCWEWTAALFVDGYGNFGIGERGGRRTVRAHRYAWELENGPVPPGIQVLHRCDNRKCVRVEHLFLGTNQDNMTDKVAKGRQDRGETHGRSKLTAAQATAIRNKFSAGGVLQRELAAEFGISKGQVGQIVRGDDWRDAGGPRVIGSIVRRQRISDEEVAELRRLYEAGLGSYSTLGRQFGISASHVGRIILGKKRVAGSLLQVIDNPAPTWVRKILPRRKELAS